MTIPNARWQCAFSTMPPNTDAAIMMLYTEPGFVGKDVTLFLRPGSSLMTPLEALLSVMQRQGLSEAMVAVLTVHAAANVVELFVQTQVVLQTIAFLDSGFVTSLCDPVSPYDNMSVF